MHKARVFMQRFLQERLKQAQERPGPPPQVFRYALGDGEALVLETARGQPLALCSFPLDDAIGRDRLIAELRPQSLAILYFAEPDAEALVQRQVELLEQQWPQRDQFWVAGGGFGFRALVPTGEHDIDFVSATFDDAEPLISRCLAQLAGLTGTPGAKADAQRLEVALHRLLAIDAVVGAAVIEIDTGLVLVHGGSFGDVARTGAAASESLRAQRFASADDTNDQVEDVLFTSASHYQVVRTVRARPELCLYAVTKRAERSLGLVRLAVAEVEASLS